MSENPIFFLFITVEIRIGACVCACMCVCEGGVGVGVLHARAQPGGVPSGRSDGPSRPTLELMNGRHATGE